MALNFGILQPVNIGGQIMAGQQEAQRNQLAQQQLRAGEMQQQKAEMELTDFKAKQEGLDKFLQLSAANGKTGSPEDLASSFYDFALSQRDPQLIMTAQTLAQAAKERSAYNASRQPPKLSPVAPAPGALGSGTFDVNAPMPAANRLAPAPVAPAAPVNQLGADTTALENRIIDLQTNYPNVPQAQAEAARLVKQLEEARKPQVVAPGSSIVVGGKPIFTAPKEMTPTELVRNYEYARSPAGGNYRGTFEQFKAISTPKTNISVSTEKKYGEQFAGKMADTDIAKMATAEKAPQLAESANRIINLVQQGNVFTGPVADIKLNIARALNVAGASNEEKIANTESLISATGKSTLDAIQSAGLGTGQGFTDKDLNFLKGIAGGTIQLTAQTLTELARLQHQTATRSAEAWNTRVKQLPKSATEGTGLSTEPIKVPPLSPSAMFARNPKTGERIQSLDGGNTWKPVGGK